MFQMPSRFPSCHSFLTQAGRRWAFTAPARPPRTPLIGRSLRFQMEMAGNQSSGDTSIDISSACAAKHFAFVMRHGSLAAFPAATISASRFFNPGTSSPVERSVTSCRNLRRRYVSVSVMFSTYGSHHVVSA